MNRRTFWMSALAVGLIAPFFALAQNQGGQGGPGGGFNAEEFRKRMIEGMTQALGATPDEMAVITPKLEKVMTAQRDAMSGRMGGFGFGGGRGGRGQGGQAGQGGQGGRGGAGGGFQMPETPASKAAAELRTTLEKPDAPAEEINAKLTALREARAKARADLEAAQKDLVGVLTPRQEAVLVGMGMVE